jgi:hypothetical protein
MENFEKIVKAKKKTIASNTEKEKLKMKYEFHKFKCTSKIMST